ncbi:MAG TPA: DUF2891 family protein [Candidatus Eremiobacteraceae bacterium]|nr:DUF2891 family protein [Candidatus Eremiobacteraceae bacterium]
MNDFQIELAPRIAPVVLANITTRFPYHDSHLFREADASFNFVTAHPAFGNSFDWHSSVHSHWTAMQLLDHFAARSDHPACVEALHDAVVQNLTANNIAAEGAYFAALPHYERPYGWAWAMLLAAAAESSSIEVAREPLRALATQLAANAVDWLGNLTIPVRHGVHGNTAFALGLMFDAGQKLSFSKLLRAIETKAHEWFADDREYPQAWERSGNDFLSPGLAEADLMRRLVPQRDFRDWWNAFMPDLRPEASILSVAQVPDVSDGQIVHLHGLNLSRAGMLARIAQALALRRELESAERLYRAGVNAAVGHDYLSTHWLATFAWDAARSLDAADLRS